MESAVYPGKTGKRRFFYGAVAFRGWRMMLSNSLEVPEESQKSPKMSQMLLSMRKVELHFSKTSLCRGCSKGT